MYTLTNSDSLGSHFAHVTAISFLLCAEIFTPKISAESAHIGELGYCWNVFWRVYVWAGPFPLPVCV